jgi:hypothetical protein
VHHAFHDRRDRWPAFPGTSHRDRSQGYEIEGIAVARIVVGATRIMPAKELKLNGGLNDLRVNESEGYLAFTIQTRKNFKGDTTSNSMVAMLDRHQQHLLMLYLKERLERPTSSSRE